MTLRSLCKATLLLALVVAAPSARAAGFSTTNVQLLQGYKFNDPIYFTDGTMTTVTFNHFSTWEHGDNFFFADFYTGHFKNGFSPAHEPEVAAGGPNYYKLYAEWHPRLFIDSLLGQKGNTLGFIKHYGLAAELNQSQGFGAYLAGVGFDLDIPGFAVAGLNLYYRWDSTLRNVNFFAGGPSKNKANQWQVSPFWTVPFSVGPVPVLFTGFVDVNGQWDGAKDKEFIEIWAQPELLVDVVGALGGPKNKILVGSEWFYHRHPVKTASVPQAMIQWNVY